MRSPIDDLKLKLDNINNHFMHMNVGSPMLLQKAEHALSVKINQGEAPHIDKDQLTEAIKAYHNQGLQSTRQLRVLCWNLTTQFEEKSCFLEYTGLSRFLNDVTKLLNNGNLSSTSWWRGLLHNYFQPKPYENAVALENWNLLKKFLADSFKTIYQLPKLKPLWIELLSQHQKLLSDHPCQSYVDVLVTRNNSQLESLSEIIPETSWFWGEVIIEQIKHITEMSDQNFKHNLDTLLEHLKRHPLYHDQGIKLLLNRYQKCSNLSVHEKLRDFSIECWGSPQLARQAKWGLVEREVKDMVSQWFALEDLEEFFDLLQTGRRVDKERFEFWKKYIKQITYTQIILGSNAWDSRDADYVNFRNKRRKNNRLSNLAHAPPTTNAFLMRIAEYYFVEFSEKGNACYGYPIEGHLRSHVPSERFTIYSLKHRNESVFWGSHNGRWEQDFINRLVQLGIYPDDQQATSYSTHQNSSRYEKETHRNTINSSGDSDTKFPSLIELQKYMSPYRVEDKRYLGGALWVFYNEVRGDTPDQLRKWGFTFSGKGYWKK
ncbi:MAG: hypothetical protein HQM12_04630 [SAR324 cluster bacterium]|nr:hypothetical protein [SAR324 cluster bacterium]